MRALTRRLANWFRRRSFQGASPITVLGEFPRHVLSKSSDVVMQAVNRRLSRRRDDEYGAKVRQALAGSVDVPYFLVLVPDLLHYVIPCLDLAVPHVPVIVVMNGVRPWEEAIVAERYPDLPKVKLRPTGRSMLPHGLVLDILLRHADRDVALMDPDLYVFDPSLFSRLRPGEGEMAVGAFGVANQRAALRFATTHMLAINVAATQSIMERHGIGPTIYHRTPRPLVEPLGAIGIGDDNFPKEYLDHYDPLNLIMATALAEGLEIKVLDASEDEAVHVGGVSYFRGSAPLDYFNLKLLELERARSFAERYRRTLAGATSIQQARARLVGQGGDENADRIDRIVDRLRGG